ncbi:MAG TPA: hypothetical protein PKH32_09685, partial [Verrucomicrobiota bacterium]|nr:hypothetical protein [Verrucomicrobiota bacterium]
MYAGGLFVIFQLPNLLQNLAMLNGDAWEPLGSGITGQQVNALVSMGSDLIVGAYFSETGGNPASGVARWNGSAWSPLGAGVSAGLLDGVHAMAVDGETLYVTGYFTTAGDSPANAIAKWENGAWSTLGDGISSAIGE